MDPMPPLVCAAKGCDKPVRQGVLTCNMHWVLISDATRAKIYLAYGRDPGGREYLEAVREAVLEIKAKEDARKKKAGTDRPELRAAVMLLARVLEEQDVDLLDPELVSEMRIFVKRHSVR